MLRCAVGDLSWLVGRGYAERSALTLVGDRYQLRHRQRLAVMRSACTDAALRDRRNRELQPAGLVGKPLEIDGYNVLTTVEAALAGGVLLLGRDGCLRDLASMHGSYRKVTETRSALGLAGKCLDELNVAKSTWYLDAPVSNSGRLRQLMGELAAQHGWRWRIELAASPDHALIASPRPVASADRLVLDGGGPWFNLARRVVAEVARPWIVDLSPQDDPP